MRRHGRVEIEVKSEVSRMTETSEERETRGRRQE